jgi:tetratricopeptide (TPR) repeat protein
MKNPAFLLLTILLSQAIFHTQARIAIARNTVNRSAKIQVVTRGSAKFYNQQGNTKFALKDYRGAIYSYTKTIDLKADSKIYVNRAIAKSNLKDFQGAVVDLNKAIDLKADSSTYQYRAFIRSQLKDFQSAIKDLDIAIKLNPKFPMLYVDRGNAKARLKDYAGSIEEFTKTIEVARSSTEPQIYKAYYNRGISKSELKDHQGAIDDYSTAIIINKNDSRLYYSRGNSKSDLKNHQGAIDDYTKAIELKSDFFEVYYNRGCSKSELKDYQGAIKDYTKAIELSSTHANTYFNRGMILSKLGEKQAAISDLENALKINPKDAKARRNLDLIQSDVGYQFSSLLSTHSLLLIMVAVSIASMGIWRYRKSSMKVDNFAPKIVNIIKPATIIQGQATQFSAVANDIDSLDTLTYSWNFGDNTESVLGRDPVHVFSSNGYYDVVLTVTDKDGGMTMKTVRVKVNII